MPTTSATGTLSARLGRAQGRPREEIVVLRDLPGTEDEAETRRAEQTRCASSVRAGQRCAHAAVVGGTLCSDHVAMMGTPATRSR